jgi:hypothetical protein
VAFKLNPFLGLVSASIREGISPVTLRNSVNPIYKQRMKEGAHNYHLVTLIPAISNILERVIVNQLIYFLFFGGKNNMLNKSQSGFKKNKSTKDTIATIIKIIVENLNNISKMQLLTI